MTKPKPPLKKTCERCSREYSTARGNSRFCSRIAVKTCVQCGEEFSYSCGSKNPITCGKSCGSKYIRAHAAKEPERNCGICGQSYKPGSQNSKFCLQVKSLPCLNCGKLIESRCTGVHRQKHCDDSCRNSYMRRELYEIKGYRKCRICSKSFQPTTSRQRICPESHTKNCHLCGRRFELDSSRILRGEKSNYCDNSCSTLSQMNSRLPAAKISAYKKADEWALAFRKAHGRKPNSYDWKEEFGGLNIPKFATRALFSRIPTSFLEEKVNHFLRREYPQYTFKRNYRQRFSEGFLELDFYCRELGLGFEVQDFGTHDKNKEGLPGSWGLKKGPEYHRRKREAYGSIGMKVFELWEDSILDGAFSTSVAEALNQDA